MRKPPPSMIVALTALVVALGGSAMATVKLDSSAPLKVCVAAKEGKPVVTPKGGVCKKGYTLTEVNKEGPEGKQGAPGSAGPEGKQGVPGPTGANVVARVHLSEPFIVPGMGEETTVTLATWTQGAEEVDQVVGGQLTFTDPAHTECVGGGIPELEGEPPDQPIPVLLDGREIASVHKQPADGLTHTERVVLTQQGRTSESLFLEEPGKATRHTLALPLTVDCGSPGLEGGGHFQQA